MQEVQGAALAAGSRAGLEEEGARTPDPGLHAVCAMARFHRIAANPAAPAHQLGDIPLDLWLSVLVAVVAVAWFLGEDAAHERRRRQLMRLERALLWAVAFALAAGALGVIGFFLWQWAT